MIQKKAGGARTHCAARDARLFNGPKRLRNTRGGHGVSDGSGRSAGAATPENGRRECLTASDPTQYRIVAVRNVVLAVGIEPHATTALVGANQRNVQARDRRFAPRSAASRSAAAHHITHLRHGIASTYDKRDRCHSNEDKRFLDCDLLDIYLLSLHA
jgi:hypothetical protein